jgi:hypothetical protein
MEYIRNLYRLPASNRGLRLTETGHHDRHSQANTRFLEVKNEEIQFDVVFVALCVGFA